MILLRKLTRGFNFIAKMSQNIKRQAERAQRVQQNVNTHQYNIQIEAKVRRKVSIESTIQDLQKQMREEIARSLKQSQMKVLYLIQKANIMKSEIEKGNKSIKITDYNQLVSQCESARWAFMVHRQAVGFTIKNYELVMNIYKIPSKIIEERNK